MIKNIVFDMGKVLVDYSASLVCEHYIEDFLDRERVCTAVFQSQEWVLMDMGLFTEEQALKHICGRLPERLHESAMLCLRDWHIYNMQTMTEMDPLIRELKANGYGVYICSNAQIRLLDIWKDLIPAAECFDGVLYSADVKCIKPQKEIYHHLFQRFDLKPEECFFIDDLDHNIAAARECGMDGYCFADGDVKKLRDVLLAL